MQNQVDFVECHLQDTLLINNCSVHIYFSWHIELLNSNITMVNVKSSIELY